jgi:membrane protease YdiL (CAAX protease family)
VNPDNAGYFAAAPLAPPPAPPWSPVPFQPAHLPPPPVWTPPAEEGESGVPVGQALVVTGLALAASLFLTLGARGQHVDQYDTALRKGLVYTLFFYLAVGSAVGGYVVLRKVRLVWHRGSPLASLALGLPVGVVGGGLAVLLNSAIKGHLAGDPSVELLVGGGGALRIFVALAVTSVLAPLVEETVFRGICAGSLLAKGTAAALWVSALAFAIWHMQPASLRYYALMGLLLGRLWQKRGLLASMSAHACFNGMLTVAAIAATGGAATFTTYGPLHFELPGGWHPEQSSFSVRAYRGPAGASLALTETDAGAVLTADDVVANLRRNEGTGAGLQVLPGTEQAVDLHGVDAVTADVTVRSQRGHLLVVPLGRQVYSVVVVTGGSPNGERDWQLVTRTLEVVPQG